MAQRHFEGKDHAESYQRYRVSPPQELVDEVLNFLRKRVGYVFKNFSLHPFRKAYIGSSSLEVYKKIYDSVSYNDKEWHECLKCRMIMPLSGFIGLVETFSTYQGFLEKDPVEAKRLSQTITDRLLEEMGASSTDAEVTVVVKYFYLLASKPQKS
ncbi:hypothetical protein cypCar_00010597 [Cyprinus carpio]|nr:hypothetical protein cypCar_00010597 [Cyprinus carpio]